MSSPNKIKEAFGLVQQLQTAKEQFLNIDFHNITVHYEYYRNALADAYLACKELDILQEDKLAQKYLPKIESTLDKLIYQHDTILPKSYSFYAKKYLGVYVPTLIIFSIICAIIFYSPLEVVAVIATSILIYFMGTGIMYKRYEKKYITQQIPKLTKSIQNLHKDVDKLEFLLESHLD